MDCQFCNEPLPDDKFNSARKYCNDKCRFAYAYAKRNKLISLGRESTGDITTPLSSPSTSTSSIGKLIPIEEYEAMLNHTDTNEFLFRSKIQEMAGNIIDHKEEKTELKRELKEAKHKYNELMVEYSILTETHKLVLLDIERGKKSLMSEFMDVVKSKEAMEGIASIWNVAKGEKGDA